MSPTEASAWLARRNALEKRTESMSPAAELQAAREVKVLYPSALSHLPICLFGTLTSLSVLPGRVLFSDFGTMEEMLT